jgi:hypothetical protein
MTIMCANHACATHMCLHMTCLHVHKLAIIACVTLGLVSC